MSAHPPVRSTFDNKLDHDQRTELWTYDAELRELGFPRKLRWELVDEYAATLRARTATSTIDRID